MMRMWKMKNKKEDNLMVHFTRFVFFYMGLIYIAFGLGVLLLLEVLTYIEIIIGSTFTIGGVIIIGLVVNSIIRTGLR